MVVICPKCKTKLKVPEEKIAHHLPGEKGTRFKCPKCQTVFLVKKPAPRPAAPAPEKKEAIFTLDRKKAVVAHADGLIVERIKTVLEGMGLTVFPFTDGVETMVAAMKERPCMILIDVALPKIYGFEVIKRLRGRPETRDMTAILISSIYDRRRYRREPASLYGADDYIDEHEIEKKLQEKIRAVLGDTAPPLAPGRPEPISETTSEAMRAPEPAISALRPAPRPASESPAPLPQAAPPAPPPGPEKDVRIEKAKRLARTILADINLYAPEKVNFAVKNNNFEAVFATELKEGKRLYDTRIPQETRDKGDFFREAIDTFLEKKKKSP